MVHQIFYLGLKSNLRPHETGAMVALLPNSCAADGVIASAPVIGEVLPWVATKRAI